MHCYDVMGADEKTTGEKQWMGKDGYALVYTGLINFETPISYPNGTLNYKLNVQGQVRYQSSRKLLRMYLQESTSNLRDWINSSGEKPQKEKGPLRKL